MFVVHAEDAQYFDAQAAIATASSVKAAGWSVPVAPAGAKLDATPALVAKIVAAIPGGGASKAATKFPLHLHRRMLAADAGGITWVWLWFFVHISIWLLIYLTCACS
jgi:hypothetical protein